jgi:hypothetical protein
VASVAEPAPACIDILKAQAVNSMKWVLAPLDETVPADIRQNLTLLREDLVDEGKTKPAAPIPAYSAAWQLCQALVTALDERDRARVAAGYRDAQAAANSGISGSPQLNTRRNYMMSWPQYAREGDQRSELQRQSNAPPAPPPCAAPSTTSTASSARRCGSRLRQSECLPAALRSWRPFPYSHPMPILSPHAHYRTD